MSNKESDLSEEVTRLISQVPEKEYRIIFSDEDLALLGALYALRKDFREFQVPSPPDRASQISATARLLADQSATIHIPSVEGIDDQFQKVFDALRDGSDLETLKNGLVAFSTAVAGGLVVSIAVVKFFEKLQNLLQHHS